jgi:hypothetical protein
MKKNHFFIALSAIVIFMVGASFMNTHDGNRKSASKKTAKTCNAVTPTNVHATVSGGTVTVTWDPQGGGVFFTVGGYYHSGNQIPHSCPATSGYTFPQCDATSCGGTLRVTAWCGTCQNATGGVVSGPVTF